MTDEDDHETSESSEAVFKLHDLRQKELIESEKAYLDFLTGLNNVFDEEDIFKECLGNLKEVVQLSEELIKALEKWEETKSSTPLSSCFLPLKAKFLQVYEVYCVEYQSNLAKLKELQETQKSELEGKLALLKADATLESLQHILIMPVQRIMRYPLILKGILDAVTDKAEKEDLENVFEAMRQVADDINEKKRTQEIHQLRRQIQRSQRVRISSLIFDFTHFDQEHNEIPETPVAFQELLNNFARLYEFARTLKTRVLKLSRDLAGVITSETAVAESIQEYYENTSNDAKLFLEASRRAKTEALASIEKPISEKIVNPVDNLLAVFETINDLIKARSRLIMECKHVKLSANISSDETLQHRYRSATYSYQTLHSQLSKELPIFLKHAEDIVKSLSLVVLDMKKKFLMTKAKHVYKLGSAAQKLPDGADTLSQYEDAVQKARTKLEAFSFVMENIEHTSHLPELLRRSPLSYKLVTAIIGYRANKSGEITVEKGDVLSLLSKHGTVSQVALANRKGYVPSCILRPHNPCTDQNFLENAMLLQPSVLPEGQDGAHNLNRAHTMNRKELEATGQLVLMPERPKSATLPRKFDTDGKLPAYSQKFETSMLYPDILPPTYESLFSAELGSPPSTSWGPVPSHSQQSLGLADTVNEAQSSPLVTPPASTSSSQFCSPTNLSPQLLTLTEESIEGVINEELPSIEDQVKPSLRPQICQNLDAIERFEEYFNLPSEEPEKELDAPVIMRPRGPPPVPAPRRTRTSMSPQILPPPQELLVFQRNDDVET